MLEHEHEHKTKTNYFPLLLDRKIRIFISCRFIDYGKYFLMEFISLMFDMKIKCFKVSAPMKIF